MPLRTYHVFISHSWNHNNAFSGLQSLLHNASGFFWKDYSVPKENPLKTRTDRELAAAIRSRMAPCSVVLVLAGVYSTYSKWIDKEIDIARSFSPQKPIIGVIPHGQVRISQPIKEAAQYLVGWNTKSIVTAVRLFAR